MEEKRNQQYHCPLDSVLEGIAAAYRKTEVDALCEAVRAAGYEIDEATAEAALERWSYAMSATRLSGLGVVASREEARSEKLPMPPSPNEVDK